MFGSLPDVDNLRNFSDPDDVHCESCRCRLGFMRGNPPVALFGNETIVCRDCVEHAWNELRKYPYAEGGLGDARS